MSRFRARRLTAAEAAQLILEPEESGHDEPLDSDDEENVAPEVLEVVGEEDVPLPAESESDADDDEEPALHR